LDGKIKTLKEKLAHGVTPALATPIGADSYSVNTAVLPTLIDFLLARGVKGVFAGGTTGEGITLSLSERYKLHEATVSAVNGRVPVLVHVGSIRTDEAIALAQHAAACGADAIAAVTPPFYQVDDAGLAAYYHAIAAAAPDVPLILYDIPHMAVNGISPALLARLAAELPTVAGVKTSRADAGQVTSLVEARPARGFVLAGNETVALGLLMLGADGLLSGLSTAVPEPFVALTNALTANDLPEARRQQTLIRQILALASNGQRIGWIKAILDERGVAVGRAVPPRTMPTGPCWPPIAQLLEQ
jgi:dihydrodipicolinate synthase/N-acetylneuraminate lyase